MTAVERTRRADAADALCTAAFARASRNGTSGEESAGVALVAVGGYGRRELAPHSDLDVVLVHTEQTEVEELAAQLWYPLWDAGVSVDHAVRELPAVTDAARKDLRVALGLLDARHLAGDPSLTLRLRSEVLSRWRREARERLPGLKELVDRRVEQLGELAHATVPDLKESGGGLRDATVLNALVATWLVDVPHSDLERSRQALLDVRDALHAVAGRASDRIAPDMWADLARTLGHDDPAVTQRLVREIGRRTTHISRLTWRRVEGLLAPATPRARRTPGPAMQPLGHGLAVAAGEVVMQQRVRPGTDTTLLLMAAAEAAERDLILSPYTVARLLRECSDLPDPWPGEARELLVRLLGAGRCLLAVWETLDETGALARLLPEWERVRLLPHASQVHRFTVDRHLVETCVEASRLIRRVARPDLLLLASLVHDLGKGGSRDHSVEGEPLAAALARRLGLADADVAVVAALVRWHLLLAEAATTRDLEDPATVEFVLARVPDPAVLELLAVLTEADARATSAKAWTPWRASLVKELLTRVRSAHDGSAPAEAVASQQYVDVPAAVLHDGSRVDVRVQSGDQGSTLTVVTGDRLGVLAAVSGVFAEMRLSIRSARAWTQEQVAVSRWQLEDAYVDAALVRDRVEAALEGRVEPGERVRRSARRLTPSVAVRPEASRRATVLEVRVEDRPGVVHLVCWALADIGVAVRSAHVGTVGPQAVDVFYLQEESAGALGDGRAAAAAHAVRAALTGTATLDV
jgi:[protein-PII] uridylyltransferase